MALRQTHLPESCVLSDDQYHTDVPGTCPRPTCCILNNIKMLLIVSCAALHYITVCKGITDRQELNAALMQTIWTNNHINHTAFFLPTEPTPENTNHIHPMVKINMTYQTSKLFALFAAIAALSAAAPAFAVDAAAAETVARQNGCFKCHATDRKKEGPAYREVSAKYKGKAGSEARLYTHITTGEKAKFADGHEEDHKIIKTKDEAEIKNLISWILSL